MRMFGTQILFLATLCVNKDHYRSELDGIFIRWVLVAQLEIRVSYCS